MSDVCAILEFRGQPASRLHFRTPRRILEAHDIGSVRATLDAAERAARAGSWAVGFVAYEAAPAFDPALATRPHEGPAPLAWFAIFDAPVEPAGDAPDRAAPESLARSQEQPAPALEWRPDTGRAQHADAVARIRAGIGAGAYYQVNHTLRFRAPYTGPARSLHDALAAQRHGRYHALIETDAWSIVSASPELFLDRRGDTITTRPMKGTVRRGRWLDEDRTAARSLAYSAKDRAENLMIVDLLRNDLGRIARFGSVHVARLFDIETYPTVHQLTSTITAQLRDGVGLGDVFAATFPCGSVTGAPKVAAMKAIAGLESAPRGPYCGAIGVVRPDGSFTFSVAIRTVLLDTRAETATYGAGGGITWDSRAGAEYDEVVAKAALLRETVPHFELLETLRLDDRGYARLPLHLERLRRSAAYWGFDDDIAANAVAALEAERAAAGPGAWRVRLTAARDGSVAVARTSLPARAHSAAHARDGRDAHDARDGHDAYDAHDAQDAHDSHDAHDAQDAQDAHDARAGALPEVALAAAPVSRDDRMLFHKTTARDVYDRRRADHPALFDVLLWNEEGEVTEFTNGNVVARIDGVLRTPPLDCGLLAGTMREQLLRGGVVHEHVISIEDLGRADAVWFTNSVRGRVRVRVRETRRFNGSG